MADLNIVEASIDELQAALSSQALTSVELVARYLRRISVYDCRGTTSLNAIPVLNNAVFEEAAASDDRRAAGSLPTRPLEGIPYTVKDSFKVRGMTAAAGSPAFEHLVANEDAFTVQAVREAGGVLIGRTNMPPMAYGGMQRGVYGRAESPYNLEYLAAAFWSGSSNGSGVSTAASFAAFGLGEETVSSGRAPASNNALVAYTPSRGWISIRGNWPLYVTCDVVVPHTRTMCDMTRLLEVIAAEDPVTGGDFWRDQPFVKLDRPWAGKGGSFGEVNQCTSLAGLRIAVPEMYIGGKVPEGAEPITTSTEVVELWEQARKDLEALGAEIVVVPDFPVVTAYENSDLLPEGCPRRPDNWHFVERGQIIAHAWNDFLRRNQDRHIPDIFSCDLLNIYPESLRTAPELKHFDRTNAVRFGQLQDYVRQIPSMYDVEHLEEALKALEGMRKVLLEDWLDSLGCHCVAFPAAGDVARADADAVDESAAYAKRNGVFYSNGNRSLRHVGVPTVSVPMGVMRHKGMPVNLTFAGKAYDDLNLLRYGNAFEMKTRRRVPPPLTPALDSDVVKGDPSASADRAPRPILSITRCDMSPGDSDESLRIGIGGTITVPTKTELDGKNPCLPELEVTVDSRPVPATQVTIEARGESTDNGTSFTFLAWAQATKPVTRDPRTQTMAPVARDQTMVVVLARSRAGGRPSGWLKLLSSV